MADRANDVTGILREGADSSANDFPTGPSETVEFIRDQLRLAKTSVMSWRREAERSDHMYAGWQWEASDLAILKDEERPAITFNRIKPFIDSFSGFEVQNRQEARLVARNPEMEMRNAASDLASESVKWAIDNCNGADERSAAFKDNMQRGMGWLEFRMDYDDDPEGKVVMERVDGLEMWWDPASRKQNLEDAKWVARKKWMRRKDVFRLWPDKKADIMFASIGEEEAEDLPVSIETASPIAYAEENQTVIAGSPGRGYMPVTQFQWFEMEDYYRMVNPDDPEGDLLSFNKDRFETLRKRLLQMRKPLPKYVKHKRKRFYQAFIVGSVELEKEPIPVNGFTLRCVTGYWDQKEKIWFGLVRVMSDPQKFANKWLSQGLHIVNTNAKGGLIAEIDAFENPRKAEEEWSNPSKITFVRPNGIGKIQEKKIPEFPPAIGQMMQYAITALKDVTGVSLNWMQGEEQGSVPASATAVRHNQSQALMVLAPLFNALSRFRKEETKLILQFVREFIADGRLIRIGGDFNAQAIPLLRDPLMIDYDVVIDENPQNPNTKMEVWGVLSQMAPALLKFNAFAPELLDYSPLPASVVQKLKERMAQAMQAAQQPPPPQPKEDPQLTAAKIEKLKADALLQVERAQALDQDANYKMVELILNQQKEMAEAESNEKTLMLKAKIDSVRAKEKIAQDREKHAQKTMMDHQKHQDDISLRREEHEHSMREGEQKTRADVASKMMQALQGSLMPKRTTEERQ